jgi:hypothetical protein
MRLCKLSRTGELKVVTIRPKRSAKAYRKHWHTSKHAGGPVRTLRILRGRGGVCMALALALDRALRVLVTELGRKSPANANMVTLEGQSGSGLAWRCRLARQPGLFDRSLLQ